MQLNPREYFTIVRQIEDHTDVSTYYVRAVIRNAKSDALIETVDLTDRTGNRFSKSWLVPADVSGQGFYISILTSVYTDAGHTTKSQNYGDKIDVYLVQARMNSNLGGFGGGSDIDYKRIQKMIDASVDRGVGSIKFPVPPKFPKIPEPKEVDLATPLAELKKTIPDKLDSVEPPEKMDMTPMMDMMQKMMDDMKGMHDTNMSASGDQMKMMMDMPAKMQSLMDDMKTFMQDHVTNLLSGDAKMKLIGEIIKKFEGMNLMDMKPLERPPLTPPGPPDRVKKLLS